MFIGQLRAEMETIAGHEGFQPGCRLDQLHAVLFQRIGNRAENRAGISFFELQQQCHGAEVRAKIEKILWRNLTHHDALLHAARREGRDHFGKLADFQPDDIIDEFRQFGIGFALKRHRHEPFDAQVARLFGEKQRQRAIACDDA